MELTREHDPGQNFLAMTVINGWSVADSGQVNEGIAEMRQGFGSLQPESGPIPNPLLLACIAETLAKTGEPDEAMKALADAFTASDRRGFSYWDAELHRLKGVFLKKTLSRENGPDSEACFREAIEIARRQNAKSLELRGAADLARLLRDQGQTTKARDLLAPIYNWFTEGLDTADLKDAKALLDELG